MYSPLSYIFVILDQYVTTTKTSWELKQKGIKYLRKY